MKILTGNSNKQLSNKISKNLKNKLVNTSIRKFADGEIYIEINENLSRDWPVIDHKVDALPDAEDWADLPNKRQHLTESL